MRKVEVEGWDVGDFSVCLGCGDGKGAVLAVKIFFCLELYDLVRSNFLMIIH